MKKKGFTLVEMLAVIGILSLLVLLVLPNVIKSFRDAKKLAFIDEAKVVYEKAKDTFLLSKTKGKPISYISNNEEDPGEKLELENIKDLKYTVIINKKGEVTEFVLKNNDFCIVGTKDFLNDFTKEQVIDLQDLGEGIDEELISKCSGDIIHQEGASLALELKTNDNDKRHGAVHEPTEVTLTYGDKWYNKKTPIEAVKIPHREDYYFVGSYYVENKNQLSDIEVIGCNGTIEIDKYGYASGTNLYPDRQTKSIRAEAKMIKKYYILSFKLGEKETGSIDRIVCSYNETCTIPTNKDPDGYGLKIKKTGYFFKGWKYKNKVYEDDITIDPISDSYEGEFKDLKFVDSEVCSKGYVEGDSNIKEFEAVWDPIKYTIRYNANGGTGEMADTIDTYGSQTKFRENTFTKFGSSFLGWSTNSSDTTAKYADKSDIPDLAVLDGTVVDVYAIWKDCSAGTYLANNVCVSCEKDFYSDLAANDKCISCPEDYHTAGTGSPSRSACTIECGDNTTVVEAGKKCVGTCSGGYSMPRHTVTAVEKSPECIPNIYKVTLSHENGSASSVVYEKYNTGWYSDSGATSKITSVTKPTPPNGYRFEGYYTATTGGSQVVDANGNFKSTTLIKTDNATIYARYALNEITAPYIIANHRCQNEDKTTDGTYVFIYGGACKVVQESEKNYKVYLYGDNSSRSGTHNLKFSVDLDLDLFLVGGGGASGTRWGGGGGGGYTDTWYNIKVNKDVNNSVTIGAGGVAGTCNSKPRRCSVGTGNPGKATSITINGNTYSVNGGGGGECGNGRGWGQGLACHGDSDDVYGGAGGSAGGCGYTNMYCTGVSVGATLGRNACATSGQGYSTCEWASSGKHGVAKTKSGTCPSGIQYSDGGNGGCWWSGNGAANSGNGGHGVGSTGWSSYSGGSGVLVFRNKR